MVCDCICQGIAVKLPTRYVASNATTKRKTIKCNEEVSTDAEAVSAAKRFRIVATTTEGAFSSSGADVFRIGAASTCNPDGSVSELEDGQGHLGRELFDQIMDCGFGEGPRSSLSNYLNIAFAIQLRYSYAILRILYISCFIQYGCATHIYIYIYLSIYLSIYLLGFCIYI